MVNLFFFLKFKSQLRRTRPDLIQQIDESLSNAISNAGGKITGDRFIISAVFNEDTIGFWLDIYILIENLLKNIESSREFYGYSLVICGRPPNTPELLCRFLANHSGVFIDENSAKKMLPYTYFEKPSEWLNGVKRRKYGCGSYYRISELKVFKNEEFGESEISKHITDLYEQEKGKNTLVLCPSNLQRSGLYNYYKKTNGANDFPALIICFESIGIGSLVDIWSLNIRSLANGQNTEEIDNLWEFLFKERVRDEVSEYVERCVRKFLILVFDFYIDAAAKKKQRPVLFLENIHLAETNTRNLLLNVISDFIQKRNIGAAQTEFTHNKKEKQKILILGTSDDDITQEKLQKWEMVFDVSRSITDLKLNVLIPRLSYELWEIIYSISLFNKYFSPELFQRLFEEEDKNPVMITKAFSILYSLGIIDSMREPRLMNNLYEEYASKVLLSSERIISGEDNSANQKTAGANPVYAEDKVEKIKAITRGRLISWAVKRNINPCFRLLSIISSLGGVKQIDDMLLLKSLTSDIVNKTITTIETAMKNGQFETILTAKAAVIRHIYKTSRALNTENEKEIEKTFTETKEENFISSFDSYPVLNAQIVVNFCCYYLGKHDEKAAVEKAKESVLLGQSKNSYCLPQSYRLFALVCLSKQQINETIEYLGFALTNAEKIGNNHELAISAYYAAAVQFLYGDIYNAAKLASKSIEQSLAAGHPDWADRSRFLEGRLEMELGHYKKAHDIFDKLKKEPYGSMTDEKENLLSAWIYRSKIYLQDPKEGMYLGIPKPEPVKKKINYDADLFEIEAEYLYGNYKRAYELSSKLKNPFTEENFLYTEKADWRSGFTQCEHLYFNHGEIQSRMIRLFYSLSLSRLPSEDDPNGKEEAIQEIQKILRDETLCEIDPWEAFYFYAKYLILEQTEANNVDLGTSVSMAFKRLQKRAGRIDDIETRRQYLTGSRWSHELSAAAREFRLI
ncbi:MAG: hypothetical protein FWB86_07260 [Treponema sp.]|nr:hypothetical protein [Treponema sp.]MCL2252023.1 hypothetical protein [Treponema sp.]